jgi:hypothetical protein
MEHKKPNLYYSEHYETLVALVTHLGAKGGDEADAANPIDMAKRLGLDEAEVENVLDNFKGLFRKSENPYPSEHGPQHRYMLQLRYARRKYVNGKVINVGEALSNGELFSLLEFVTNKVREEQENERQARSNKITMIGVWIAAALSLASTIVSLLK